MFSRRDKEYTKLPGRRFNWVGENSLWLGKDHLLYVRVRGFKEYYKRFYFNDIESIMIQDTSYSTIFSVIYILLGTLAALGSFYVESVNNIVFYIIILFFLLLFLINILAGSSCVCFLSTAVQTEKLISLNRLRNAQKVINILRYNIENVQGNLTSEMIQEKMSGFQNQNLTTKNL